MISPVPSRLSRGTGRDGTGRVFSKDHGIAATLVTLSYVTVTHPVACHFHPVLCHCRKSLSLTLSHVTVGKGIGEREERSAGFLVLIFVI